VQFEVLSVVRYRKYGTLPDVDSFSAEAASSRD